jgi:hypothetical protein
MMFKLLLLVYLTLPKLDKKATVCNVAHFTAHFNSVGQYRLQEIRARSLHIVIHCLKK